MGQSPSLEAKGLGDFVALAPVAFELAIEYGVHLERLEAMLAGKLRNGFAILLESILDLLALVLGHFFGFLSVELLRVSALIIGKNSFHCDIFWEIFLCQSVSGSKKSVNVLT